MELFVRRMQVFFTQNKTPIMIIFAVIGLVFMLMFLNGYKKEISTVKKKAEKKAKSGNTKMWLRNTYFWVVEHAKKIPLLGSAIINMSYTNQCQFAISDEEALMLVGKTLTLWLVGAVIGAVVSFVYFSDILIMVMVAILFGKTLSNTTKMKPLVFLGAMADAIDDFIHSYHEHSGNIDQAFHDIINSDSVVAGHFDVMYRYIKEADVSQNPEEVQKEYNSVAPSKILRNFYSVVYMTYKYGDTEIDGKSAFSTNVYQIQEQISGEVYEIESLKDGTAGEGVFIMLSIFMLPLVEWYMLSYFNFEGFEYVQQFMTSVIGYMVKIACAATAFVCHIMYEKLTDLGTLEARKKSSWETRLLHNYTFRSIVNWISPPAKRGPLQDKIIRCGSTESVAALTCKRVLLTAGVTVLCIISVVFNIVHTTNNFLNDPYQGLSKEQYEKSVVMMGTDPVNNPVGAWEKKNNDIDKMIINALNQKYPEFLIADEEIQEEWYKDIIAQLQLEKGPDKELVRVYNDAGQNAEYIHTRVMSKMTMIQETKGLYNVVFIMIAIVAAFYMPVIMVYVQSFLNAESMLQSETADLQRMTLMLIQHSSCTPEQLLDWYTNSTRLFAKQFHEASITRDLMALADDVGYKPFTQLMECLNLAMVQHMSLDEAFAGIEQKMRIQEKEEQRRVAKQTKFRVSIVNGLTSICLMAVIGLYMFVPMAISMLQMFGDMGLENMGF